MRSRFFKATLHYSSNWLSRLDYSKAALYRSEGSSAWLATLYPMTNWLDFDEVAFFQGDSSLFFELVEPVGLFKGGLILGASEAYSPIDSFPNFARSREDWTGSAILIDPEIEIGRAHV